MKDILLEEFNSCPGKEAVEQYLAEHGIIGLGSGIADVENAKMTHYQNDDDTLVLRLKTTKKFDLTFQNGLDLGTFQYWSGADEFHILHEEGYTYLRFWWD